MHCRGAQSDPRTCPGQEARRLFETDDALQFVELRYGRPEVRATRACAKVARAANGDLECQSASSDAQFTLELIRVIGAPNHWSARDVNEAHRLRVRAELGELVRMHVFHDG